MGTMRRKANIFAVAGLFLTGLFMMLHVIHIHQHGADCVACRNPQWEPTEGFGPDATPYDTVEVWTITAADSILVQPDYKRGTQSRAPPLATSSA